MCHQIAGFKIIKFRAIFRYLNVVIFCFDLPENFSFVFKQFSLRNFTVSLSVDGNRAALQRNR
jgi:hypothetical protein